MQTTTAPIAYLSWRQTEKVGEMLTLGGRQVALLTKSSFQFVRLCLGEQHTPFLLLGRWDVGC